MKIRLSELRQVIREELEKTRVLAEGYTEGLPEGIPTEEFLMVLPKATKSTIIKNNPYSDPTAVRSADDSITAEYPMEVGRGKKKTVKILTVVWSSPGQYLEVRDRLIRDPSTQGTISKEKLRDDAARRAANAGWRAEIASGRRIPSR